MQVAYFYAFNRKRSTSFFPRSTFETRVVRIGQTFCQSVPFHQRLVPSLITRHVWPLASVH